MLKRTILSVALASGAMAEDVLASVLSANPYLQTYYSSLYGEDWQQTILDFYTNSAEAAALASQYAAVTGSVGDYSYDTSSFLSYYGSVFGVSFSDYNAFLTFGENLDVSSYLSHLSQEYSADPSAYSAAVAAFQSDATLRGSSVNTADASSGAGGTGSNSIASSTTSGSGSGSESGSGSTTEASGRATSSGSSHSASGSSSGSGSGSSSESSTSSKAGVYSVGVPVVGLFAAVALVL